MKSPGRLVFGLGRSYTCPARCGSTLRVYSVRSHQRESNGCVDESSAQPRTEQTILLPVSINFSTRPAHFVRISSVHFVSIKTVALVHVKPRSACHALAFAETVVTNFAAYTVSLGRHSEKICKQSDCCGAEKYRTHFLLLRVSSPRGKRIVRSLVPRFE